MRLIGCVDTLNDTGISGWAADELDPEQQIFVDILVNSLLVATVRGTIFREDLRQAGIGDGRKGFQFDPRPYLNPGRNDVEVRYNASGLPVPRGQARLVRRSRSKLSGPCASFLTALQAYYQFSPGHHICEIGPARLHSAVLEAQLPFRKYSTLDLPGASAAIAPLDKADLVISSGWERPLQELTAALKNILERHTNRPGYLALDFSETDDAPGQIRNALQECGVPRVKFDSIPSGLGDARRLFAFGEVGGAETSGTEPLPVLAHIHVPKCAGTSFRYLFENYFGSAHLRLYVNDTYFVYTEDALRHYLLAAPESRAFSSHHVRTYPRWLAGREMLYITFLRDPIQQFVSYMTHIKKHYAGITSKSLLAAVPPDAPKLTLREFASWLLTHDRDIPFRENHNVNFFARHTSTAADSLEAAKSALAGFFFVGITERMDESMRKLRSLAHAAGLDFPPDPLSFENTSNDYRDDLSWINPADQVGAKLLRSVEKDQQLYRWAAKRLDEDLWPGYRPKNRLELSVGRA
ncbi:MAG: sulfotransferase family 2 domain-containing protein [Bryobacteraceae bacterium]|jgi:hypothetical protein